MVHPSSCGVFQYWRRGWLKCADNETPKKATCCTEIQQAAEKQLMQFYLEAQAEQDAQLAQSGCSSAQMRSADGVHWSA